MPTKRRKKTKNGKFFRNVLIGVIALGIVAFIINTAPGYKRDKYANVTNLVITDTNVTENLKHKIYVNENGTVFISQEDIKELIDKTIYFDEKNGTIITTSDTKVASMSLEEETVKINGANVQMLDTVKFIDNTIYIPITELESVYNIDVNYIKESDIVVIDKLNSGIITAQLAKETKMKFRPRGLSKKVKELSKGERVYAFYTTSKGWRLIRTEDGTVGYVKANTLTNEYIVRHDMQMKNETQKLNLNIQDNNIINNGNQTLLVRDLLVISNEGITLKGTMERNESDNTIVWVNLSNNSNMDFTDYTTRTGLINNLVSIAYTYRINGININFARK